MLQILSLSPRHGFTKNGISLTEECCMLLDTIKSASAGPVQGEDVQVINIENPRGSTAATCSQKKVLLKEL